MNKVFVPKYQIKYQRIINEDNSERINMAFDILFDEINKLINIKPQKYYSQSIA